MKMLQLPHTKSYVRPSEIDVLDLSRHTLVFSNGHAWSLYAQDEAHLARQLLDLDYFCLANAILNPDAIVAMSSDCSKAWLRSGRRVDVPIDGPKQLSLTIERL